MGFLSIINQPKLGGNSVSLVGTAIFVIVNIVSVKVTKIKAIGIPQYPNWDTVVSLSKVQKVSVYAASSPISTLKLLLLCIRGISSPPKGDEQNPRTALRVRSANPPTPSTRGGETAMSPSVKGRPLPFSGNFHKWLFGKRSASASGSVG